MKKPGLLLLFLLSLASQTAAAKDGMTRVGVTFLGTGFLSFSVERCFGANSIRINAGMFEPGEVCTAVTVNRYLSSGSAAPYIGIGLWNVFIFPEGRFGRLDILNIPVGMDVRMKSRHHAGAEIDMNRFLRGRQPGGGDVKFRRKWLVLPAVYYKYEL